MKIDLHTHTTFSDGTLDPEELVDAAHGLGITHMAIVDHDSTGSLDLARAKAAQYGLTVIPGVEINTKDTVSVHVLGYFVEEKDEQFQKTLVQHRDLREKRAQVILDKLHRMGIKISLSDFGPIKDSAAIGRPHIEQKWESLAWSDGRVWS